MNQSRIEQKIESGRNDVVNHPSHYNGYAREVIDSIEGLCTEEEFRGYLKGNFIKYIARYRMKNGVEDLEKAQWYLAKLKEAEEFLTEEYAAASINQGSD